MLTKRSPKTAKVFGPPFVSWDLGQSWTAGVVGSTTTTMTQTVRTTLSTTEVGFFVRKMAIWEVLLRPQGTIQWHGDNMIGLWHPLTRYKYLPTLPTIRMEQQPPRQPQPATPQASLTAQRPPSWNNSDSPRVWKLGTYPETTQFRSMWGGFVLFRAEKCLYCTEDVGSTSTSSTTTADDEDASVTGTPLGMRTIAYHC